MLERELKINFKPFLIWTFILIGIYLMVFLIYPSIISSPEMVHLDEMMKMFPEEIIKAFNMDLASINSAYGWLKSEGFVFILLVIGAYAGIMGSNILLKEESDKTIEYLNSLPVTRNQILLSKIFVGIFYILLMCIFVAMFNYIGLTVNETILIKEYILLSITPIISGIVIFFLCLFISTFTHKTKKMLGISLGIVFISYILNTVSLISSEVEFLKYFSIYTLADVRNVLMNCSIDIKLLCIGVALSIIFLLLTVYRYNKKELV